jgi:hypothetical protein
MPPTLVRKGSKGGNDGDASERRESEGEEPKSDDMSQGKGSDIEKRKKKPHKKRGDRKGKEPVRPVGFMALMSSISYAGRNETVSRHEPARMTMTIPLKRGRKEIPTGLQIDKADENEGCGRNVKPSQE